MYRILLVCVLALMLMPMPSSGADLDKIEAQIQEQRETIDRLLIEIAVQAILTIEGREKVDSARMAVEQRIRACIPYGGLDEL